MNSTDRQTPKWIHYVFWPSLFLFLLIAWVVLPYLDSRPSKVNFNDLPPVTTPEQMKLASAKFSASDIEKNPDAYVAALIADCTAPVQVNPEWTDKFIEKSRALEAERRPKVIFARLAIGFFLVAGVLSYGILHYRKSRRLG